MSFLNLRIACCAVSLSAALFFAQAATLGYSQEPPPSQTVHWTTVDVGCAVRQMEFVESSLLAISDGAILQLDAGDGNVLGTLNIADTKLSGFCVTRDSLFLCGAHKVEYGFAARILLTKIKEELARPTSNSSPLALEQLADWSKLDFPGPLSCVVASEETVCVGDEQGGIAALRAHDGSPMWTETHHAKLITAMTLVRMPDDSLQLASGDWAGKIIVSDIATGRVTETFTQHRDTITALRANSDAAGHLYSASRDGTVRLWYVHQGRLVRFVRQAQPVVALDCLADGAIICATRDCDLLLVDTGTAEILDTFSCSLDYIHAVASSKNRVAISDGRQHISVTTITGP